ncbi:hypothetical protein [Streptomyces sp. NPDC127039]|uniref:hypothetical protein n=1 Tax=Streptomyces sp. NPDC127039 TaxID=3347115 RepID=UPI003666D148
MQVVGVLGHRVQGVDGHDRAGDVGDQVKGGREVHGLVGLVAHLALGGHPTGTTLVDTEQVLLQAVGVAGAANRLAVRGKLQDGRVLHDSGRRVADVGLHEDADGRIECVGVDPGKGARERGGHRQLRQITVGDFERGQDAGVLAVRPADHTAHRAHPAQQGAGHRAEQHREGETRPGAESAGRAGADRLQERGEFRGRAQL